MIKALSLLALLLASSPVNAAPRRPGVRLEVLREHATRATVLVANPGSRRAPFYVAAYDAEGGRLEGVKVSHSTFSLSSNRYRKVRFENLPPTPLMLCATVVTSPSLSLRSCVFKQ